MYAIRSKSPVFRRSGVTFTESAWRLVEQPTPEQLAEPMLISMEVDGPDDPHLLGLGVVSEERPAAEETDWNALCQEWREQEDRLLARIADLEVENAALQAQIEAANVKGGKKPKADAVPDAVPVPDAAPAVEAPSPEVPN